MRVLHLITTLDVGGAEMHLLSQVRGQCARGHDVRVAWLKGDGALQGDFEQAGARCVGRVGSGPALVPRLWPELRAAEIVHSHLLKADMVAALLAPLAGRRSGLVSSKHNDERALLNPVFSRVHGLLGRSPRKTIVLSDHVGEFIREHGRIPADRLVRIHYGHDHGPWEAAGDAAGEHRAAVRPELGFSVEDVVMICVARFAPQKAHDVLLEAFARARAEEPRLKLALVGDDPFGDGRERTEAVAAKLDLGDSVHFTGVRRDVPRLMAASDVFVMSSLWEGFGLVFLEAMSTGIPVLATRVSGVPEVVADGETGVLVPPHEVEPLAEQMVALARDGDRRRALGQAGRARVRARFGIDRMVDQTLDVYRSLG